MTLCNIVMTRPSPPPPSSGVNRQSIFYIPTLHFVGDGWFPLRSPENHVTLPLPPHKSIPPPFPRWDDRQVTLILNGKILQHNLRA